MRLRDTGLWTTVRAMFILASPHIPDGASQALALMYLYPFAALQALTAWVLTSRRKWRRASMRSAKWGLGLSILVVAATVSLLFEKGELGDEAREKWWVLGVAFAPLVVSAAVLLFGWRSLRKNPEVPVVK